MAEWTAKYIDDLPDASFAYIQPGGKKDSSGKTTPRSLRHFPIRDQEGKSDRAHVANALARAPQSPFGHLAMPKIRAAAKELKIGEQVSAAICAQLPGGDAPKSILLIPAGEFNFRDGRESCTNDDPAAAIAATAALDMTAGLPIDYDHATDLAAPKGLPAPAAGWIKNLRVQDGAIWGDVEWTEPGAAAVAAGEWKYISPVFEFDKKTRRVTRVLRAALTNNPALYDTAIAARQRQENEMEHEEFFKKMAALFGLPADSKPEDVHEAAQKHFAAQAKAKAKADADGDDDDDEAAAARLIAAGKVVAQKDHASLVTENHLLKAAAANERATAKVDAVIRAGKLTPAQRDWAISYCARDEKEFDSFAAVQPEIPLGYSRVSGAPPASADGTPTPSEIAVSNFLTGLTAAEIAAHRGKGLKLVVKSALHPKQEVNLGK